MAIDKQNNIKIRTTQSRKFLPEGPPREVWVGILGLPFIGMAIGAFNYYNTKKDFKASLKKKVQAAYENQITQYSKSHHIPREDLTKEDYAKIIDKEKCLAQAKIVESKRGFVKNGKHGWTIAGIISGFAGASIIGGLLITTAPFSLPTTVFVGIIAAVAAVVAGVGANVIAGKAVEQDANRLIADALNSPKNQQGIDRVEQQAQQKSHDKQKERIAEKVKQYEQKADLKDRLANPEKYIPKNGFAEREMQRRQVRETALAK